MGDRTIDREALIALCEAGLRPEAKWHDRDSESAQRQLGEAWVLLRAGCEWRLASDPGPDQKSIWIEVTSRGFQAFELGDGYRNQSLFYIPTRARLDEAGERDWY